MTDPKCAFCAIIQGESRATAVLETERLLASRHPYDETHPAEEYAARIRAALAP